MTVPIGVFFTNTAYAQADEKAESVASDTTVIGDSPLDWNNFHTIAGIAYDESFVREKLRNPDQKLSVFGYYRLFGYGRNMTTAYPNLAPYERAYGVGDGYREPMLSLNVVGRPTSNTTFGTELYMFTPYLGDYTEGNTFTTNLGINFYGNFRTDYGKFGIRAGGIHWYNLSSFTIGLFQVLDRFTIFDRTPWEGVDNTTRYDNYYNTGVAAAGDLRWNNQAFQGLILNGGSLPYDFAFDMFWGRTQPAGGLPGGIADPFLPPPNLAAGQITDYSNIAGLARTLPSIVSGGKVQKTFGDRKNQIIGYNMLRNVAVLDSLSDQRRIYQVHTMTLDLDVEGINITGELGAGSYKSPTYTERWGEALMLRVYLPKKYTKVPVDVQVYQISKDFFNQSGEIFTNSNPDIVADIGLLPGAVGAGGQVSQVNQLVHNRRGVNANARFEYGIAKFNVGWGVAREIEALSTQLNFLHRVNGLALSRIYNPFPENATGPTVFGPYGRKVSFFRGVSEVVSVTDIAGGTGEALTRKYFNSIDLQGKISTTLFGRDFFIFYLGTDQLGTGVGIGFDWAVAENAGIYVRHRWMNYRDRSFALDKYAGREITIELKTFF
ncbi:MAG: hypothetical protein LC670_13340 [Flavobacteriales bacterium]|nr:hypothetical protein [Flavobacteriales bacterium]